uniref:Uncharacterized protein n=1 Tax=Octopus bimaculoides TaxID=37653 RepID=A0A0L8H9Z9_OCTBM
MCEIRFSDKVNSVNLSLDYNPNLCKGFVKLPSQYLIKLKSDFMPIHKEHFSVVEYVLCLQDKVEYDIALLSIVLGSCTVSRVL